ncbi:MAG: hypothetical protein IKK39_01400 [Thermoguttaceae bacterium]|nr:hypothetical protein [Thermoguttaceae bacterium]MBR4102700.1 hypothetical protein [Thermoguttaceae bacterium]
MNARLKSSETLNSSRAVALRPVPLPALRPAAGRAPSRRAGTCSTVAAKSRVWANVSWNVAVRSI